MLRCYPFKLYILLILKHLCINRGMVWRINLRQFEAFRAVMMTGSTTKAADVMNISQPAVSRLVRDLESQLDVELFSRRHGRLLPTPHGNWLFQQTGDTLSRFDRLNTLIRDLRSVRREELKISATQAMAYGVLPGAIAAFREAHPEVSVSVEIVVRREIRNRTAEQLFDLSVTTFPIDYPAPEKVSLVKAPAICVLPTGHRLSSAQSITPKELATAELVMQLPESQFRFQLDRILEREGIPQRIAVETQSASAVCAYVASGLGIGIVDPFTAFRYRKMGLTIRPFMPRLEVEYGILHPVQKQRHPQSEEFIDTIRQSIQVIIQWYDKNLQGSTHL